MIPHVYLAIRYPPFKGIFQLQIPHLLRVPGAVAEAQLHGALVHPARELGDGAAP